MLSSFKLRLGNAAAEMFCQWCPAALGAALFLVPLIDLLKNQKVELLSRNQRGIPGCRCGHVHGLMVGFVVLS